MFSSIFSSTDPRARSLHSVNDGLKPSDLYGELEPSDLHWVIAPGFATETHIWYTVLDDGKFLMCQIIHSSTGLWYPTIQFTCRLYDPKTNDNTWRSVNVSNFTCPMPGSSDKSTAKSDHFTIDFKPGEDTYIVTANPSDDFQVSITVARLPTASGFKVGKGPKGGYTHFGADIDKPDGFVFHKFWPATTVTGTVVCKGKAIAANGTGMFIHAIQGMRPDKVANRWNYAWFHSPEHGGIHASMMEFTSTADYGKTGAKSGGAVVNVGGLVVEGKLVAVTGETLWPGEKAEDEGAVQSRAFHYDTKRDPDTGYDAPARLSYHWSGPSIDPATPGTYKADLDLHVGDPAAYKGLIEKVDVMAEIPKVIKAVVAHTVGAKPYIYTWMNPATLSLTLPSGENLSVEGTVFNEASFVS